MEDMLQNQIRSNCRLALPNGLKELMCDISREVLRAQPVNLYDFIANYLSVLLLSREHLSIAHHVCDTVCTSSCYKQLEDELQDLGLEEEKVKEITHIIVEHYNSSEANRPNLLAKLVNDVGINEHQLDAVKKALHTAFKRHLVYNTVYYQSSSDEEKDEVDLAAKNTLKLLRKTKVSNEEYLRTIDNVKASYRAYGVTRRFDTEPESEADPESDKSDKKKSSSRNIRFDHKDEALRADPVPFTTRNLSTVSSITVAGSYVNLPKYVPYSVHRSTELPTMAETYEENYELYEENLKRQKISFQEPRIEDVEPADDDTDYDETVEEVISLSSNSDDKVVDFVNYVNDSGNNGDDDDDGVYDEIEEMEGIEDGDLED